MGDLCDIIIGHTPKRNRREFWGGDHPWATIADIKGDEVTETKEKISDAGAADCKDRLLPKGTLLFSFKLSIGKTAFAGCDLYTNEAIAGLIPKSTKSVDKRFLKYALSAVELDSGAVQAVKGKTLNLTSMSLLAIPLPPLPEQQRIVARLERQMALVEKARLAAEEMLENISSLKNAILRELLP